MTNHLCDLCGTHEYETIHSVHGVEKEICIQCSESLALYTGREEELFITYTNDYVTEERFSEDYMISVGVAEAILKEGRKINYARDVRTVRKYFHS